MASWLRTRGAGSLERSARSVTVLGVEGMNGMSLQQETFEKMERGARERRKSVWSTAGRG